MRFLGRRLPSCRLEDEAEAASSRKSMPALLRAHVGARRRGAHPRVPATSDTRARAHGDEGVPVVRIVHGAEEGRRTLLRRQPLGETELPEAIRAQERRDLRRGPDRRAAGAADHRRRAPRRRRGASRATRRRSPASTATSFEVPRAEIDAAYDARRCRRSSTALREAAEHIRAYHERQREHSSRSFSERRRRHAGARDRARRHVRADERRRGVPVVGADDGDPGEGRRRRRADHDDARPGATASCRR